MVTGVLKKFQALRGYKNHPVCPGTAKPWIWPGRAAGRLLCADCPAAVAREICVHVDAISLLFPW